MPRLLFPLLLMPVSLLAQPQHRHWLFGSNAGVDMGSDPPVALEGVPVSTDEGVASIADEAGQLLFHTNGENVWNALHQQMPTQAMWCCCGRYGAPNLAVVHTIQ